MANDYGRKKLSGRKNGGAKPVLLVFMSFLVGYLSASVFDFTTIKNWVNQVVLAQKGAPAVQQPVAQQAELPKPKFEFYTLLAKEQQQSTDATQNPTAQVAVGPKPTIPSKSMTVASTKTVPVSSSKPTADATKQEANPAVLLSKGSYLVQVAAFKSRPEAERMKAGLVLKGFVVNIAVVNQQNTNWYRVSLGPFRSKDDALKAQTNVARSEHIIGMVRRMDA